MAMSEEHKDKLRINYVQLTRDMKPVEVIDHLYAAEILTDNMKEELGIIKISQDKASALVDLLVRRGDRAFGELVAALRKTNQPWLADLIEN